MASETHRAIITQLSVKIVKSAADLNLIAGGASEKHKALADALAKQIEALVDLAEAGPLMDKKTLYGKLAMKNASLLVAGALLAKKSERTAVMECLTGVAKVLSSLRDTLLTVEVPPLCIVNACQLLADVYEAYESDTWGACGKAYMQEIVEPGARLLYQLENKIVEEMTRQHGNSGGMR